MYKNKYTELDLNKDEILLERKMNKFVESRIAQNCKINERVNELCFI